MPRVSVVLPFFNAHATLQASVESILKQDFSDFELLLINNASTDGGEHLAQKLEQQDARIKLIHETQKGVVYAANTGMRLARGFYIARMDADDVSLPSRLGKQIAFLDRHPDIGVVATQVAYCGNKDNTEGFQNYVIWNNQLLDSDSIYHNRFIEMPLVQPSVMFRRELIKQHGDYKEGNFPEDYELWLRWLTAGIRMQKLPEVLLQWHDSPTRLTRTDERYTQSAFYTMKTNYLYEWLRLRKNHYPKVVVWGAGRISRQRFALLEAKGVRAEYYIDLKTNPERNVIAYTNVPTPNNHIILVYVANREGRKQIVEFLSQKGYAEGNDFICVA